MEKRSVSRVDTLEKVCGTARYADDLYFSGMLFAQTVHCPHAHAEIVSIDPRRALACPGVVGVYTAKDVPGINQLPQDKPMLARSVAKYVGDGVAVVAAETQEAARRGAELVEVRYKVLKAVLSPEDALEKGAVQVHESGNYACAHTVKKGDLKRGFAEADVILERTYRTQRIAHSAIEPDVAVVVPENGGLTIYAPCKGPYNCKKAIARTCGLTQNKVRLIQPAIGGSFGGKDIDTVVVATRAAVVALATGRPCKMRWSREEVMEEGSKRHPFTLTYKIGAKRDGKITALQIDGLVDVGAYLTRSLATIWRGAVEAGGPYQIDNLRTHIQGVYTNQVMCDAVRGFGSPQVDFASESMMNELAEELGINPLEIRRKNCFRNGSITATGQTLQDVSLPECLDKLEEYFPDWNNMGKIVDGKVRGFGFACLHRGESYGAASKDRDVCSVDARVHADGSVSILTSISEVGQGNHTVQAAIAAETLGIGIDRVHVQPVDTAFVPDSGVTAGSRGTISGGSAVLYAATELKDRLARLAGEKLGVDPHLLRFHDNNLDLGAGTETLMSFDEAVALCFDQAESDFAHGIWVAPKTTWDFEAAQGHTYYSFSYGAAAAEIEVDMTSGKINVKRLVSLHDVGKILNYEEASGQIAGGAAMALGYSLTEETSGEAANFDRYLLPTSMDIIGMEAIPLEIAPDGTNPLGVHGVGEASTALVAPCIANALDNALGIRLRSLPFTLEKVRAAIDTLKGAGAV